MDYDADSVNVEITANDGADGAIPAADGVVADVGAVDGGENNADSANSAPADNAAENGANATNTKKPAKKGGISAKKTTTKASAKTSTKTNSGTTAKKPARKAAAKATKGGVVVDGADNKKCACPLCSQEFTPADGYSPTEHLTKGLITVFAEMQINAEQDTSIENPLPCPRCGQYRMLPKVHRNSLSRHEQIYVCPICGTDEAVRVHSDTVLPTSEWWICGEILGKSKCL